MRWHFTGILLQQYHTQVGIPIVPEGALPLLYLVIIPSGFNLFRYFYYYFLIKNQAIIRCIIIIVIIIIIIIMKSGSSSPIMKRKLCAHDRPAIPGLLEVVLFYYLTIGTLYMYIPFCWLRHAVVDGLAWCNIISKLVNNWLGPNVFPSLLYISLSTNPFDILSVRFP